MLAQKTLITIVGPTASGKSALAVEVAKHFNSEVVSADSRQVYREMHIAVAKPTDDEMNAVKHHLIGTVSIHDTYSAGLYAQQANQIIEDLFTRHDKVVMVGGSGLYINAVIDGMDDLPGDLAIRSALREEFKNFGLEPLQNRLSEQDSAYFAQVDQANPHRIMRALEVIAVTGEKYSVQRTGSLRELPFKVVKIGLTAQREFLYNRINCRVDQMVLDGLVEEAKTLHSFSHLPALQTVGYNELFEFLDGKVSLQQAIEKIKQHTRQYAKRQLTWWRRDADVNWAAIDQGGQLVGFVKGMVS